MSNLTMSSQPNSAYLEIILGSMYSGKTSRLVEIYKQYKFCNIPVVVINHSVDTRYDILDTNILVTDSLFDAESTESLLSTHDKIKIPCIKTENLFDICAFDLPLHESLQRVPRIKDKFKLITSEVVLINEGQFFPDLEEFIKIELEGYDEIDFSTYERFIELGAKWQAERMYSEEDMEEAFENGLKRSFDSDFDRWFEQFKKK